MYINYEIVDSKKFTCRSTSELNLDSILQFWLKVTKYQFLNHKTSVKQITFLPDFNYFYSYRKM